MLYELAIMIKPEIGETSFEEIKQIPHQTAQSFGGEIFVEDDWGNIRLAMPTRQKVSTAHFIYFVYSSNDNQNNQELDRRLRINENILRWLIVKLPSGEEEAGTFIKNLRIPYSKKYGGSVINDLEEEYEEKEGETPQRNKNGQRNAEKIEPDWKDPQTYAWLLNEFGKISPARVTRVKRKYQRFATRAVKRARYMGMASYVSNQLAE